MSGPGTSQVFDFTGTLEAFIVPATGTYEVTAYGGQGGGYDPASFPDDVDTNVVVNGGGLGGESGGVFGLTQGQTLLIVVGSEGLEGSSGNDWNYPQPETYEPTTGGGGGGSFVALAETAGPTPLVVAGGGGGELGDDQAGGAGGTGPAGDGLGSSLDGGGGGFYGNAADYLPQLEIVWYPYPPDPGQEYIAFGTPPSGGLGFTYSLTNVVFGGGEGELSLRDPPLLFDGSMYGGGGGFGGGGGGQAGTFNNDTFVAGQAAGGGGGYSGGDPGQGGTSFVSPTATNVVLNPGVETGNGEVIITELSCFAAGTRLATPSGPRAVETLKAGDMVLSHLRSIPVSVLWVGNRRVHCVRHPDPAKVLPVSIRAGAFGPGLPVRNLLLSPDHAVFVEGVLIPVWVLVNGTNVRQQNVREVTYWHVELAEHDVLLAEGLPVESYLDAGGRAAFIGGPVTALAPDFGTRVWEAQGCAPLRVTGPEVDAVRERLARRLGNQRAERAA